MNKGLDALKLSDDFLFRKVFLDTDICKEFLTMLLGDELGAIERVEVQDDSVPEDPSNRGVRFDVFIEGKSENAVVEMQVRNDRNLPVRTRLYLAHADTRAAASGDAKLTRVKDTYIIFICMFDPGEAGTPLYEVRKMLHPVEGEQISDRLDTAWEDGSHIYLLNTVYETPIGSERVMGFLDYVYSGKLEASKPDQLLSKLDNRIRLLKGDKTVREDYFMYEERIRDEGRREGRDEGFRQGLAAGQEAGREMVIMDMVKRHSIAAVCEFMGVDEETIRKIFTQYGITLDDSGASKSGAQGLNKMKLD